MPTDLRKTARGQQCMVRLPGVCNYNPETTVLAHLPNQSMGKKSSDLHGAYCCSDCHDVLDGRRNSHLTRDQLRLYHMDGVIRTQRIWIKAGVVRW